LERNPSNKIESAIAIIVLLKICFLANYGIPKIICKGDNLITLVSGNKSGEKGEVEERQIFYQPEFKIEK